MDKLVYKLLYLWLCYAKSKSLYRFERFIYHMRYVYNKVKIRNQD